MKLNNVRDFSNLPDFIRHKLLEYEKEEKNFESLFKYMFCESENIMAEVSVGYKIKKIMQISHDFFYRIIIFNFCGFYTTWILPLKLLKRNL